MSNLEQIVIFKQMELEEAKKEKKRLKKEKKKHVCIDPDSVIGKEITYQTALLHEIRDAIWEARQESKKREEELNKWMESYFNIVYSLAGEI